MRIRLSRLVAVAALILEIVAGCALAAPVRTTAPRAELDALQAAIDAAVSRVSRPSGLTFGRAGRAYHLPGYGAFVVLAPRTLPRAPRHGANESRAMADLLRRLDESIAEVRDPAERRRLQETVAALRAGVPPGPPVPMMRPLPRLAGRPGDPASMQVTAEAFRRDAERAMQRAERDVLVRLQRFGIDDVPPAPPVPPVAVAPVPPVPAIAPPMPFLPPAPPEWSFMLEPMEDSSPDRVVADVRRAIVTGLGGYGGGLTLLGPEEFVVVAVDFVPRMADQAGTRTVVARARKSDLVAHRAGRLTAKALHARVAFDEY